MTKNPMIRHAGIVDSVSGNIVRVKITAESACAQCHAKSACTSLDSKEKIIEIETTQSHEYKTGEDVVVATDQHSGLKAVFWGYGLPFMMMIGVLLSVLLYSQNELLSGLSAIFSLVVYYSVLYFFNRFLTRSFRFYILHGS